MNKLLRVFLLVSVVFFTTKCFAVSYKSWTDTPTGITWYGTTVSGGFSLGAYSSSTDYKTAVSNTFFGPLVIPNTIAGLPVVAIASYAFYNCADITSIIIPESVKSIGMYAFYGCNLLSSVSIPEGVTSIGGYAFYGCNLLSSVSIPEGVTSIGDYAFYGCSGLTSISIPEGVTSIGNSAFSGCSGLTSVTIPSSVTSIGVYAFRGCSGLTSISIPEGVTSIGDSAFRGCSGLTSISIPEGVTSIGNYAFDGCSGLTSVSIPEGVTSIGDYAFRGVKVNKLTAVRVCGGMSKEKLDTIIIPVGTTSIPTDAFSNCIALKNLSIPQSVTTIGESAFSGCTGLNSVEIPEGVISIGNNAFSGCTGLNSVEIPEGVISIGNNAFSGCTGLNSVEIPEGVVSIGESAFSNCSGIRTLKVPQSIISVGENAFASLQLDNVYCYSTPDGWANNAFGVYIVDLGSRYSDNLTITDTRSKINMFYCTQKDISLWNDYFQANHMTGICYSMQSTLNVIPSVSNGGTLSFRNKEVVWGETVEVTATPKDGYVFLGWGSNIEGIESASQTLTFTMPERPVTLVASFFPKALLETWFNEAVRTTVKEEVEAKIDGESLLTAEQAATKTSATIEAKVADGELITSEQLQVMAMEAPVIAVADGVAKVGVSLKRAESLNGEWKQVEAEEAEVTDDGAISVSVPADEKAAFYKFVVPNKQ